MARKKTLQPERKRTLLKEIEVIGYGGESGLIWEDGRINLEALNVFIGEFKADVNNEFRGATNVEYNLLPKPYGYDGGYELFLVAEQVETDAEMQSRIKAENEAKEASKKEKRQKEAERLRARLKVLDADKD